MSLPITFDHWPYPFWVAHRGAGKLAPENTLAAFRQGATHGYRMFECDVKLSADAIPFLLHDATLQRTTSGYVRLQDTQGLLGGNHSWSSLSQLDAGSWHSRAYAGEPLPTLENIARFCQSNGYFLNIEIKPTPGLERLTGQVVADHVARLWHGAQTPPLLTSFEPEALDAAIAAQPQLPCGLLLETLWNGWLEAATARHCVAVVCNHALWDRSTVAHVKNANMRCLSYTVNDEWAAQRLMDLGTDGIITDRIDLFAPAREAG